MPRSRYVSSKQQLAARLGIRYGTLCHYFQSPGHPPNHSQGDLRYEVEAWEQWLRDRQFKRAGITAVYDPTARERSIIEKNKIAAAREQFDLDVKRGHYISRVEVNRSVDIGNSIVKREIMKFVEHFVPTKLCGLSPGEAVKLGKIEMNRILRFLPGHFQAAAMNGNGSNGFSATAGGGGTLNA